MAYELVNRGIQWAIDTIEGRIPGGPHQILACQRFERDFAAQETAEFPYRFDADRADEWLRFLASLKHVKGRWSGERFDPSGWQCFVVLNLYGWVTKDELVDEATGEVTPAGIRRFSDCYICVPRKNGKSYLVAGLGLGHMTIDREPGAEVYCGATSEKQAWEVFRPARQMCLRDPEMCGELGIEINARALWRMEDGSRFEPVIGDPGDGPSPSCSITDEYHEHKTRNQVDTMETGMGARTQPIAIKITTAGTDFGGPCYIEHQEGVRILEQSIVDETKFVIIFSARPEVPWDSEEALRQANPNLGVSVSMRYLEQRRDKARNSPTLQSAYKTKHLNQWVGAKAAWMNMLKFQACGRRGRDLEAMMREPGWRWYIGLDLASKVDLASLALLGVLGTGATARYRLHVERWTPEAQLVDGKNSDRYSRWRDAGCINVTEGDIIDFDLIEERVLWYRGKADIVAVGYDPFQATQFATHMLAEGVPMVEVPMTVRQISDPMKELEAVIYDQRLEYDAADEPLVWQAGNVVAKRDKKQNVFPDKEREEAKIDDIVAALIAMNRALAEAAEESVSGTLLAV